MIERLGGKLPSKSCNKDNYPYVPSFNSGVCQFAAKPDLYDCTLTPASKKGYKKQRLCYCQPLEGMLIFLVSVPPEYAKQIIQKTKIFINNNKYSFE